MLQWPGVEERMSQVGREEDGAGEAGRDAVPRTEGWQDGTQRGPDRLAGSLDTTGQWEVGRQPAGKYHGTKGAGTEWWWSTLARLAEAEVCEALDPEDVSGQLPLSDGVLLQEVSLQELLLQERMGQPHLWRRPSRSSKSGRQPRPAVAVIAGLPGTDAAVRLSQEAGLQVLGGDGAASQVRHGPTVSLQK